MSKSHNIPEIKGLKYFKPVLKLLDELHFDGCQRDKAGNRKFHYDQYCLLILFSYFDPSSRSARSLVRNSKVAKLQKRLGAGVSLGSFSEAAGVFNPELIKNVANKLAEQVKPFQNVGKGHVNKKLIAVDGTVIRTLKTIAEAAYLTDKTGKTHCGWRLHTQFEIDSNVPVRIDVTSAANSGKTDEKAMLRKALVAACCYIMDRWYAQYVLLNDIVAAGSDYVCRIRDNSNLDSVKKELDLTEVAIKSGVLRDFIVELGVNSKPDARPNHPTRVLLIKTEPHTKRGGRKGKTAGPPSDGILRIATNMLDVPAEVIADIFRNRWAIEIFFRTFKHVLGCRHQLSRSRAGIEIQAYCAIIACMLIAIWTGQKATKEMFELVGMYLLGVLTERELTNHIKKMKKKLKSKKPNCI